MSSDYSSITQDNVRDYGEKFDKIGRLISEHLYPDQTHFVYELLQNAHDAITRRIKANPDEKFNRNVEFSLYPDRLEFKHFGKLFDEKDVRGICDVLAGTKENDINQIGKFGIGFKSVYAFTSSPQIHSGDEHFSIEHYIRPRVVTPRETNSGGTLFVFPFNHSEKPPELIYQSIKERLADLGLRTLLFLDQIDQITWEIDGKRGGAYIRDSRPVKDTIRYVHLLGEEEKKKLEEKWLVFNRSVVYPGRMEATQVEIAFRFEMVKNKQEGVFVPVEQSKVFAYFETDKETGLHFLIQGHYNTTPARDNILLDGFNKFLIQETANLVETTLEQFKEMRLLTAQTLEIMPLKTDQFPPGSLFRPIFETVRRILMNNPLLPKAGGGFIKADEAKLARSSELIDLLDSKRLGDLFGSSKDFHWLSDDITRDKTPELRSYLMNSLQIDEIDPERFGRLITERFLLLQTEDWLICFYSFLDGQRALWKAKGASKGDEEGVLRQRPFILCENGNFIQPFNAQGLPLVFLPSGEDTDYPLVKKSLVKESKVAEFFENLGLSEPDVIDEVLKYTLPRYPENGRPKVTEREHERDFNKIIHAMDVAIGSRREILIGKLKSTKFIHAINAGTGIKECQIPQNIYIESEDLRTYFNGNPKIWFLDCVYARHKKFLLTLGVKEYVYSIHADHNQSENIIINSERGDHERGLDGFDSRWNIEGLKYAVSCPNIKRSQYIWNTLLIPFPYLIRGVTETSTLQTYQDLSRHEKMSVAGELVIKTKWLPDKNGEFHLPAELSLDDLPDGFIQNEKLANQLGMKASMVRKVAKEQEIDETDLNLAIQCIRHNPEAVRNFAKDILEIKPQSANEKDFDYSLLLRDAFERPNGTSTIEVISNPGSIISDPAQRRERIEKEITLAKNSEPTIQERFHIVSATVWENKENSVRAFLKEQYQGKCQICGYSFIKANGEPYFEGLYLVSIIHKKWIDRPGNVLCLCANCCAKFRYGPVKTEAIIDQIKAYRTYKEGGSHNPTLIIELCGDQIEICYSERHLVDLQGIIKMSETDTLPRNHP
jgi:hypothetical protein